MKNIFSLLIISLFATSTIAQVTSESQDEDYIELSGKVNCIDPIEGTLADVTVYNKSKGWGNYTDEDGMFSIKMDKSDTIVFSTIQHLNFVFNYDENEQFKDKYIEFMMETDTIWFNTVTVIGRDIWDEFKSKFINMDIPLDKIDMHLPAINSYANQLKDVNGNMEFSGPLTHVYNKFKKVRVLKGKIEQSNQLIKSREE